jgi:hypothetical protein
MSNVYREVMMKIGQIESFIVIIVSCCLALPSSSLSQSPDINGDGRVDFQDLVILSQHWLETGPDPIYQDPNDFVLVVAASTTDPQRKARASFVCDGKDDDVEIQAALDSLPDIGGVVQLLEGTYNTGHTIHMFRNAIVQGRWFNAWLRGMGPNATRIALQDKANCTIIDNVAGDSPAGWFKITDMTLDGNKAKQTQNTHGIYSASPSDSTGLKGRPYDGIIWRVFVSGIKGNGVTISNGWGIRITETLTEYCTGDGLSLTGGQCYLNNLFSSYNGGHQYYLSGARHQISGLTSYGVDGSQGGRMGIRIYNLINASLRGLIIKDWGLIAASPAISLNSGCAGNILDDVTIEGNPVRSNCDRGLVIDGDRNIVNNLRVIGTRREPLVFRDQGTGGNDNILSNAMFQLGYSTSFNAGPATVTDAAESVIECPGVFAAYDGLPGDPVYISTAGASGFVKLGSYRLKQKDSADRITLTTNATVGTGNGIKNDTGVSLFLGGAKIQDNGTGNILSNLVYTLRDI